MSTGRLTRQEIGWLLAQEARGAARVLRKDVTLLTQSSFPAPPMSAAASAPPASPPGSHFETTLDALDGAIGMLSDLQTGATRTSRRGRIDVAALLCELSPRASIALEPGEGTEVFADEAELRRMLHVLVSQTGALLSDSAGAAIRIRRDGDFVRITAELGPDASASTEIERRWLARMATRGGGRLELEGGTVSVLLPADPSLDQSEVEDLRKELEQARELGATYARELAAVFAAGLPEPPPIVDGRDAALRRFQLLTACARALHKPLHAVFRSLDEELGRLPAEKTASLRALSDSASDLVAELGHVAQCPTSESVEAVDLGAHLSEILGRVEGRADRHGVALDRDLSVSVRIATRPQALALLLRALAEHAVLATPKGGTVSVSIRTERGEVVASFRDGGPVVPAASRPDLLEHRVDPASLGRPPGIGLLSASVVAAYLGARLSLKETGDASGIAETVEVRFDAGEAPSR